MSLVNSIFASLLVDPFTILKTLLVFFADFILYSPFSNVCCMDVFSILVLVWFIVVDFKLDSISFISSSFFITSFVSDFSSFAVSSFLKLSLSSFFWTLLTTSESFFSDLLFIFSSFIVSFLLIVFESFAYPWIGKTKFNTIQYSHSLWINF